MNLPPDPETRLAQCWNANADAWRRVVREHGIESRRLATDAAVLEAVSSRGPKRVLDVGCGEGWLCRALHDLGVEVTGVDGSPTLIASARAAGGGDYRLLSFDQLTAEPGSSGSTSYDVVVCNFALLHERLTPLLEALHSVLALEGALIIQTVHPGAGWKDGPYVDGWRVERFTDFPEAFPEPMPWFFRTLSSWFELLERARFVVKEVREPTHPDSGEPLSLLLVATPDGS